MELLEISKIAKKLNISDKYLEAYGKYKAKIDDSLYAGSCEFPPDQRTTD